MTTNPLLELLNGTDTDPEDVRMLEAALEQFALTGVRRTSIDDIARRAKVNRVTVYRRLGPKGDIVAAAFLHEAGRVLTHIDAQLGAIGPHERDLDEYIVTFFVVTITTLRQNRLLNQLLQVDQEETLQALTVGAGQVVDLAAGYLRGRLRDIRERSGGSTDPAEIAALAGLLARLAQSLLLTPDGPPATETPDDMRQFAHLILVPLLRGAR